MNNIDPFKKIPNRIGELIEDSNKTLKEISHEVNINYETLSAYKRQVRNPKKENAKKIANYFGVSVPYLLGFDDNPTLRNPDNESFLKHSKHAEKSLTLFQKISLSNEASRAFENLIYSIHLLSDRQDKHSQTYINRVTNYISQIILIQKEELGGLTPFKNAEKLIYQKEYDKYIKPFELVVAQLSEKENL
ncbi:helix-turn-helix domain-containing protein [Streptococcus thoraltensis]|uniref:helix-turn-helix domain-containing protein n=1 Tax=Streptococcus thoraltensis TaxID=55085 RepID=UPI001F5AFB0F|nr:helix-turn-helix transcriptional regulator [Streptococcus thoraltensis]